MHTQRRITEELFVELRDNYTGLCASCGEERDNTEPDARQYPCPHCGVDAVFGAESLAFELCDWTNVNGEKCRTTWLWSDS